MNRSVVLMSGFSHRATAICYVARYNSGDEMREVDMDGASGRCGEEKYIQGFVCIRPRKEPLTRLRSRWQYKFKIDLQATGCGDVDWIRLAEDRNKWRAVGNTAMTHPVPCKNV
jgi:hypothetical protein